MPAGLLLVVYFYFYFGEIILLSIQRWWWWWMVNNLIFLLLLLLLLIAHLPGYKKKTFFDWNGFFYIKFRWRKSRWDFYFRSVIVMCDVCVCVIDENKKKFSSQSVVIKVWLCKNNPLTRLTFFFVVYWNKN